jgi:hypothetical protein
MKDSAHKIEYITVMAEMNLIKISMIGDYFFYLLMGFYFASSKAH